MAMNPTKCDLCERPAVVHEVTVRNGVKEEVHLCEQHAVEAGVSLPGHAPMQMLTLLSQPARTRAPAGRKCPGCGLTFARFRQAGTLGCPQCYEAFHEQLAPLIERAQNQATHHRGKTPRRAGKSIDRQLQVQHLVKQLDEAVASEQYERAAQLRDRLRGLDPGSLSRKGPEGP
jgi:protein arginine kinase activator